MGCGCNKVRTYNANNPLIVGTADDSAPVQVRTTVAVMGMRAGSEFWVSGDGVAAMIEAGWFVAI